MHHIRITYPVIYGITAVFLAFSLTLMTFAPLALADDSSDDSIGDTSQTQTTTPDTSSDTSDTSDTPDTTATTPDDSSDQTPDDTDSTQATAPDDSTDASSSDPSITTGDASADSETDNDTNDNQTTASDASTTADDTNDATTTNDTDSDADTGDNSASGGGSVDISTGDALSQANVINVVNTNIFDSSGLLEFLNELGGNGIDLDDGSLDYFTSTDPASGGCSLESCGGDLTVNNDNDATVTNTVISEASTGDNAASSTGDASITTGDAAASANVLNVVNTNITNSHYLLLSLNNFGDLGGNIVLPSASFFDQLLAQGEGVGGNTTVDNDNTAIVDSTSSAVADTGDNTASSTGDADITTGDALSNSTTVNEVNTNLTGGTSVYILINVFGDWTGSIQGLPAGINWVQTPTGVALVGNAAALSGDSSTGTTTVDNTNDATVNNNVQVYALTGNNQIASTTGDASITTGNADASSNVVNLVNTNILGENWILAILNVFGNWTGDLDFGEPDLWIGAEAQTSNPTPPGSPVVYTFTVANNGDADATNVVLNATFDPTMLSFATGMTGTGAQWDLGTIPAGTTQQFSYTATAGDPGDGQDVAVPLAATVTEDQDDANLADNTDNVTIMVGDQMPGGSGGGTYIGQYAENPQLTVTKTESISESTAPATVNYQVVVSDPDNAGPAYNAVLTDSLVDPTGKQIYNNSWDLDTINPGDEITLTYSIVYDASSTPGGYLDTSEVSADENYEQMPYANIMPPASAISAFQITPQGQVLGASTSNLPADCPAYLTGYIIQGQQNDPAQVKDLQLFMNSFEGTSLPTDGIYGPSTIAAVKAFQTKYAADILTPWGMTTPSGNVYYTTQEKINDLYCNGTSQFPLTDAQMDEIKSYQVGSGAIYGIGKPAHQFAQAPKHQKPAVPLAQTLPPPIAAQAPTPIAEPKPVNDPFSSLFQSFLNQAVSAISIPLAHAQTK